MIADHNFFRLIVYSFTARMLIKLLYENCVVALDRKLQKALHMISNSYDNADVG